MVALLAGNGARRPTSPPAPAAGLYLERVDYPEAAWRSDEVSGDLTRSSTTPTGGWASGRSAPKADLTDERTRQT
jgi:hypothetical protein